MKRSNYTLIPIFLFLFDYNINLLLHYRLLKGLLCWFLITSYNAPAITGQLLIALILLGLYSFTHYSHFGIIYISMIPIIILTIVAKKWFTKSFFVPAFLLALFLVIEREITYRLLNIGQLPLSYTVWQFCVNILVLLIISLKIHGIGRLGNRL